MTRIISIPKVHQDLPEYVSPASGKLIRGRVQRADDFKRTGTRPWEGKDVEKAEVEKFNAEMDKKEDASLEKTAYEVLNNSSSITQAAVKGL